MLSIELPPASEDRPWVISLARLAAASRTCERGGVAAKLTLIGQTLCHSLEIPFEL